MAAPAPARAASPLLRPLVVLALPGMYLLYKYNQFRQQQTESARRRVTERELLHLNTKIDKLLNKLDENEPELATSQEDECVICVNAKATMQTSPCGHRVVCRRCFVKTIQMAVSQRLLPLRCVICRAKILRLRHSAHSARAAPRLTASKSWQAASSSAPRVPGSVSCYSVGARSVPASASLYSVTSGESSLSGVSSVSSGSGLSRASCAGKLCAGARCGGACLGAVPRAPAAPAPLRQPCSGALRRSQQHSMKARLQEYATHGGGGGGEGGERLPPIREFQREFREGRRAGGEHSDLPPPASPAAHPAPPVSVSTRIRCAQKIVTQLECSPQKKTHNFFRTPLRALGGRRGSPAPAAGERASRDIVVAPHKEPPTPKPHAEEKKKKEESKKQEDKRKEESVENKKSEAAAAARKREEKAKLKAEKEAASRAKREAKAEERRARRLAREQERQAKLLARQLERQARLDARDESKRAKRDAKLAAVAARAERDRAQS